ncbi:hypothetical protein [Nocardioides sp. Kera G14]|uniref:hypothetical protein n=1 Tax=Nocardioides sp. Kera G14 TaxID=2884264 RepID=UPI001D11F50A|nr:hypothetical protein [Nocardioides sp. Kera G14]UDY23363.1 hypothetical protein LH076_15065 [Nocardioides sp. Kera G14]
MGAKVLLHVGTPKTATTFFQDVLFRHRLMLAERGIHYPGATFDMQFRAALDLLRREWGGLEDEVVGEWDALAAEVRAESGIHIISNEILAGATAEQAARALGSFGDAEVHLVLTVRDLFRQIPAEWQETVKHFGTETYADFLAAIRTRSGRSADLFWAVQDLPGILARWAESLPPERVHIVTLPPRGTDPAVLWKRLESVFGLEGLELDLTSDRSNESMGANATSFVRGLNEVTQDFLTKDQYRWLVMELLAHRTLSTRTGKRRIMVPPDDWDWVSDLTTSWMTVLLSSSYDVVGDLDELVGERPETFTDPDVTDPERIASIATDSTIALLAEAGRLMGERDALRAEVEQLREVAGLRNAVRAKLETSEAGQRVLGLYRDVRGRSSRRA